MVAKLSPGEFVERSKALHGESKYDYSECVYVNDQTKIKLRCTEHNHWFMVLPGNHTHKGRGCTKCTGKYVPTTSEFIGRSKELHGESKYDYSECVYIGAQKKVLLRCIAHDHKFEISPSNHIHRNVGCPKCTSNYKPNTCEWIEISKSIHGESKYDYSECVYRSAHRKVKLRCIEHDHRFDITPSDHIHARVGCPKCVMHYVPTTDEFIARSKKIHGDWKYDYSKCVYSASLKKVKLRCNEHDYKFEVTPGNHLSQGTGCPKCAAVGVSKKQIEYFDYIGRCTHTTIQHAGNMREFKIPGIGKVDGYCDETNTCYEFHGDFWHGHSSKFQAADINPVNKKTYGELYQKTLTRDQKIRDLGYDLVVIWEHEWDLIIKQQKESKACLTQI